MDLIRSVEIENFKTFSERIHIDIQHPAVLIGPNNAGKTSVIQALALWSRGIAAWYEKKGNPKTKKSRERISAGINRLSIFELPVTDTRYLWKNTRVVHKNNPIEFTITVGVEFQNRIVDCTLHFTRRNADTIYCRPAPDILNEDELLRFLVSINFNLLYPMSGIETEETLLPEGRINVLMGQGQTAQVLRNLCYKIWEQDQHNDTTDWHEIVRLIRKLFLVDLKDPTFNETRGNIALVYRQDDVDNDLDIALAGRGLQQFLLILSYLFSHKRSVLLIDEPDAHLEILRQRQVYEILREKARETGCQVIIATHSEVILEEAVGVNATLLINGSTIDMAKSTDIQSALRHFGVDHYVKAKVRPNILYVEGSTDLKILRAMAKKLGHDAYDILSEPINVFYTQNVDPEQTLDSSLDRASGAYGDFRRHYHTLKRFVPQLRGLCILDKDKGDPKDSIEDDLAIVYWKDYEIENYFVTPSSIVGFIRSDLDETDTLFQSARINSAEEIIDKVLLSQVFGNDDTLLHEYKQSSPKLQRALLRNQKMSRFAEHVFEQFSATNDLPLILRKSDYHLLVDHVAFEALADDEIINKLDLIVKYITPM
ncbi:MAG: ATP-binding protein [Spirochaetales bacterium]|nr:ATP-binding protein [Spirochaetales bacterium]